MTDHERKRPKRSSVAARFDEVTLAAFTVLLLVTIAAVFTIGIATTENRLNCRVNETFNL